MDEKVAEWILEFSIAQPCVNDDTLDNLLRSRNNLGLKKRFLLRKIESEIGNGIISETTLDFLSQIEDLDHREGNIEVSETFKVAFSAVAAYCYFEDKGDMFDDKKRIWKSRECYLNVFVENSLLRKVALEGPLNLVRFYVDQAKDEMGPPFLELAAAKVLTDDALMEMLGVEKGEEGDQGDGTVKFADAEKQFLEISCNGGMPIPEVNKVQETLKTSSLELKAMVEDSLENISHGYIVANLNKVDVDDSSGSVDRNGNALQANDSDLDNDSCTDQNNGRQFSPKD